MSEYIPTIGLEVHAELKTASKMFCGCKNAPHESSPNTNVCPVCMAHPGTLPAVNKEAVRQVVRIGLAVHGNIADFTEFDRKNYFYPDIPKNYQISQYKYPIVSGGRIHGVELTRIHLEEDTARSSHVAGASLVDFNRGGVPLMELVTEPVMHDTETVLGFARDLQLLLRYVEASDANLEKGEMRVEVNISIAKKGAKMFGTKVEVKNLNSFRAVSGAIEYEIARQTAVLEEGSAVIQETRGWDEQKQVTFSQRSKENAHDYRYFPDPDIPKYRLNEALACNSENLSATLPELPWDVRARLSKLGLSSDDVETLVADRALQSLFFASLKGVDIDSDKVRLLTNYITSDLVGLRNKYTDIVISEIKPNIIRELIVLVADNLLSSRGAKNLLEQIARNPASVGSVKVEAERRGLLQISNIDALDVVVETVLREHSAVVADVKNGKESAMQFLVGQCMRITKGAGNPSVLQEMLRKKMQ